MNNVFFKTVQKLVRLAICLFRMTIRTSNRGTPYNH